MNIVCDTNVLVSGLLWSGQPARVLDRVDFGLDRLFLSQGLLDEFVEVINRKKFRGRLKALNCDPRTLVTWVVERGVISLPKALPEIVVKRDPADDRVIACAVTVGAEYVVTGDDHLLALNVFEGIPIVTPGQYLEKVEKRRK